MIKLTRFSGEEFILNADLIRFVESRPDTYVTLTTDDRFVVRVPSPVAAEAERGRVDGVEAGAGHGSVLRTASFYGSLPLVACGSFRRRWGSERRFRHTLSGLRPAVV